MYNHKTKLRTLNGAALYYAVTISIIISTILLATMLLAYYSSYHINQDVLKQKLLLNAYSGIQLATDNNNPDHGTVIDLYGKGNDSVFILSKNWGLYKIIISKAFHNKNEITKVALVGKASNNKNNALYLTDKNEPLVITGETKIIGDCFLPKSGIKRGYIEGKNYSGEKLTEGKVYESQITLPSANDSYLKELKKQFSIIPGKQDSVIYIEDAFVSEKIEQSFSKNRVVMLPQSMINITTNSVIKGNIIVLSKYPVNISATAIIEDVVFYAPTINVEANFAGSVQLFATDSIIIGKNCALSFPTSVALINSSNKSVDNPYLKISDGTIIKGNIFVEKDAATTSDNKMPSLVIEKNTTINGWVYVNGKVQHSGNIYGHLFCDGFLLKTSSSVYDNHLVDAEINCKKLSQRFVYSYLISNDFKTEIVKWLH